MNTEHLARLVDAKLTLLRTLRELSKRQSAAVEEGEIGRLPAILAGKQTLLEELRLLDQALDPFRSDDPDSRVWSSPEARLRCRQQAERCEAELREILLLEKAAETAMVRMRDHTANLLQGTHNAAAAQRAYAGSPAPVGISAQTWNEEA